LEKDIYIKLQRYNKINDTSERTGDTEVSSDAMLGVCNITSGATGKYSSEIWSLNQQQFQRVDVVQMICIRSLVSVTRLGHQIKSNIGEMFEVMILLKRYKHNSIENKKENIFDCNEERLPSR
jgi:hypothetical protein